MKHRKIVVFGSFVVDLAFRTPRLPVKGETIKGLSFIMGPGGKGSNQAVAAKRAGANITMITRVGDDALADFAYSSFKREGLDLKYIFKDPLEKTAAAAILVDNNTGDNQIVVTLGACLHFTSSEIDSICPVLEEAEYLLIQLEANIDAIEQVIEIAHQKGKKIILNPAPAFPLSDQLLEKVDYITPNETEAALLTGMDVSGANQIENIKKSAEKLLEKGIKVVIITLGEKGVLLKTKEIEQIFEPMKVQVVDTTGAGDAFNGGFVTALAEGKNLTDAIRFANVVGALSVTRQGAAPAMPYRNEIDEYL